MRQLKHAKKSASGRFSALRRRSKRADKWLRFRTAKKTLDFILIFCYYIIEDASKLGIVRSPCEYLSEIARPLWWCLLLNLS
jgi:hypothetical protein